MADFVGSPSCEDLSEGVALLGQILRLPHCCSLTFPRGERHSFKLKHALTFPTAASVVAVVAQTYTRSLRLDCSFFFDTRLRRTTAVVVDIVR